jgi:putative spermidine/putrescine transport system substrate-binding protein
MNFPCFSRRDFLRASALTAIATGLGGCWSRQSAGQIQFLNQSIPPQLIKQFQQQFPQAADLDFKEFLQLEDGFKQLRTWHNPPPPPTSPITQLPLIRSTSPTPSQLVSVGDRWLSQAIANQLLQPLDSTRLPQWSTLSPRWQLLGQRNTQGMPTPTGDLWAIPYRWGTAMMVYRKADFKRLGWQPQDWSDLWKPELRQQIALVDDAREVIGLTLKQLGYSYNLTNPYSVAGLPAALRDLQRQVKFFSTKHYLQALLNQDVWLGVGWSNEIVPLLKTHAELAAVIPASGASLWADLWGMPTPTTAIDATYDWLNFGFQPDSLKQIALFSNGLPVSESVYRIGAITLDLPNGSPLQAMTPTLLNRCEFLAPLLPASQAEYDTLWLEMRDS